ncbi:MAG: IPT/TIG domain-containing protein, partial [Prosthecobacter sp.]
MDATNGQLFEDGSFVVSSTGDTLSGPPTAKTDGFFILGSYYLGSPGNVSIEQWRAAVPWLNFTAPPNYAEVSGKYHHLRVEIKGGGGSPEIVVEQPAGWGLIDNSSTPVSFSTVNVGSNSTLTFIIKNIGTANLIGLTITKDGTNSSDFTVVQNPIAPVSGPSGNTSFIVSFAPTTSGTKTATLHIASNDSDENPFDILLSGYGQAGVAAAEIVVEQDGSNLNDNSTTPVIFPSVNVGSNTSLNFTIKNVGGTDLTGLTLTKDGTNASEFTITQNPTAPVSGPFGSTVFVVRFTPAGSGTRISTLHIASNDTDENPFDIRLSGNGSVVAVPTVTAISPTSGSTAGGTSVTITGTNFTGTTGVTIGGIAATTVSVVNATTVTCITPAHAAGSASVSVITPGGSNGANTLFTYVTPLSTPTVTAISPTSGSTAGGTNVTISGTKFTGATGVTIGGSAATSVVVSNATTITCITPAHATGPASVLVTTPGGTNAANILYTYISPPPTVTAISPTSGSTAGGTSVTITGTNFIGATVVTIGGTPAANVSVINATTITCITPSHATGTASVSVITPGGTNAANTLFTFQVPAPAPTVTAINPSSGITGGGTSVTIVGTDFTGATSVTIGGTAATNVSVINATTITCTTPAHAAGTASVSVTTPGGMNAANTLFTFVPTPPPMVMFISPTGGSTEGGTAVTITGSSFFGDAGVTFGGVAASNVIVVNEMTITCTTPAHAPGPASVAVTTPVGSSVTPLPFTYVFQNVAPSFALPPSSIGPAGATWTAQPNAGSRDWQAIASSADGTKLAAVVYGGQIYTSTDSGVSWTARESSRGWFSIASSSDGTKLAAVAQYGQIYTSTDSGVSWTARESSRAWWSIASSADGTKLVAGVLYGQIYTSTDSGVSWTARDSSRAWLSIASSADGTKVVAADGNIGGQIYTSIDSGVSWTARASSRGWFSIASSSDGTKLAALENESTGQIYTSTDSGVSWTARDSSRSWYSITSSNDGTKLAAVVYNGQIYTSTDSGTSWTARDSSRRWYSITSSGDGTKLAAAEKGGLIYTSVGAVSPYAIAIPADSGLVTSNAFATNISAGPSGESGQTVSFTVTNDNHALFSGQPAIDTSGTLAFTTAGIAGTATVTVLAHDDGGIANGGVDTSAPQTF